MSPAVPRVLAAGALILLTAVLSAGNAGARAPGGIDRKALLHDTHDLAYRSPFGAVPARTAVKLSLRTAHNGASKVLLHTGETDDLGRKISSGVSPTVAMRRVGSGKKYDLWQATVTPQALGVLTYSFEVRKGTARIWYSSTDLQQGGPGQASSKQPTVRFKLTVYDPHFTAPSWMRDAVIYQIFPDRFSNGDPANDIPFHSSVPVPAVGGQCPAGSYNYEGMCAHTHPDWTQLPEGQSGASDFFGGDLQGIIDKLPYLKGLGVNVLYLNPIFQSPSNHKYDTSDYLTIDPHFGTNATFQRLVEGARAAGIRVILDGVFNHSGADSIYFNKYGHFPDVGAYQSKQSPYYSWYTFTSWPDGYDSWEGAPTLPTLTESDPVKDFIFRKPDSVAQHWLAQGASGWRLDAADKKSGQFWREFRQAVKAAYPDSLVLAEATGGPINSTTYLLGNQMDGVMNYRFREAVTRYFAGGTGSQANAPSKTSSFYNALISILEDYPRPAVISSMNLVDSHDTERILQDLGGDKRALRRVAALQMTWLGAPTILYGDEAGLTGATDPDDRRTFPWGHEDTDLQAYYRTLIGIRAAHPALRDGSVAPLILDNDRQVLGYLRRDDSESVAVIINSGPAASTVEISGLADGKAVDALSGVSYNVTGGKTSVTVAAQSAAIITPAAGSGS